MSERTRRIVVLGGYGETGRRLCRLLAKTRGTQVVVAGRHSAEAERCAAVVRRQGAASAVAAARADVADLASLRAVLKEADLAVVAAPVDDHVTVLAEACLEAGCDLISLLSSNHAGVAFASLSPRVVEAGRRFTTHAGLCPGLPSLLARAIKLRFPETRAVRIGVSIRSRGYTRPEQLFGFVDAAAEAQPSVRRRVRIDYGPPVGHRTSVPFDLPELSDLSPQLGLASLSCFAATPSWLAHHVVKTTVRGLYGLRWGLGRRFVAGLLLKAGNRPTVAPGATVAGEGWPDEGQAGEGTVLRISHHDVFDLTAAVVSACVREHLRTESGAITGVHMMGHLLDPETVTAALREAGIAVTATRPVAAGCPGFLASSVG